MQTGRATDTSYAIASLVSSAGAWVGHAQFSQLRIAVLRKCRCGCEIESGREHAGNSIGLIDRREPFHCLNSFGWLCAIIIFNQLDVSRSTFELEATVPRPSGPQSKGGNA